MSHARYVPPDPSKGDETTIGGYAAVNDRPAAFEGSDGWSYSVELMTEETGDASAPWGGFILFVKWARLGAQSPEGHLESDFLVGGSSDGEVRQRLGAIPLLEVKALLDGLIDATPGGSTRAWWDAMRDEGGTP
jgi:hypothetical protein